MKPFAHALSAALSYAVVSREVADRHHFIGFAYRESSAFDQDSGWRFFSGGESDEYCDNPDHFATLPLPAVLGQNPELNAIINEQEGAWEWDDAAAQYVAAADWQPQE